MTTRTMGDATIVDASPFPTSNPVGDVELLEAENRREEGERQQDFVAGLLHRVRAVIARARDLARA
jgi:hypothetical protein